MMMEATEHGSRDDRALGQRRSRDRLLLCEGLMRTGLVVEADILGHESAELCFAEDEDMIEQLATEGAHEALRSLRRRRRTASMRGAGATAES